MTDPAPTSGDNEMTEADARAYFEALGVEITTPGQITIHD